MDFPEFIHYVFYGLISLIAIFISYLATNWTRSLVSLKESVESLNIKVAVMMERHQMSISHLQTQLDKLDGRMSQAESNNSKGDL